MLGCLSLIRRSLQSKTSPPFWRRPHTQLRAPLFIISGDVTGEALAILVVEKLCDVLNVVVIKASGYDRS
ncbi:unnamed protein product [Arabidopsis halleri]